jgi:beta-phosphoglucomutase-like phosphatase (HAD superfamily)
MLLIFDCDGTLVDSELLHAQAEVDAVNDIFGIKSDAASHNKRFVGGDDKQFYDWITEQTGKPVPENFSSELAKRKQSLFKNRLIPMPYIDETLDQLGRFQKCIASNTGPETLTMELKITGLFDWFAGNIFSPQWLRMASPHQIFFFMQPKK